MRRAEPSGAEGRPPKANGRWLTLVWLVGTVATVSVTVAAVQLAGSEVTGRPIPSVSSEHLQAALIDDALTLSNEQAEDPGHGTDATAPTGTESGEPTSGEPSTDDHPSGGGSPVKTGDDHPPAPTTTLTADDHGGGPVTTTTIAPGHPITTTTTAPPSGVTYSKGFTGGTVSVRCTGNRITLLSASPSAGFTTSVSNAGPEEVEVHFTSSSKETEIHAECSNGVVSWGG